MSASYRVQRIREECTCLDLISINRAGDGERVSDCWTDRDDDDPYGELGEIMSNHVGEGRCSD